MMDEIEHGIDALAGLPPPQREAVVLFYVEDLGLDEVARLTGRPVNTIKSDLYRARASLREAFEESGSTEPRPAGDREDEP